MTISVALTDTFAGFKDKTNELIVMTQVTGMATGNPIKLQDTTQSTSNTTGSIITAGGVGIAKDVTVGGSVNVHGNLHANGNITSDGSLTFGDADTDNVVFAADVNSHIIPNTDDTYDLGSSTQEWRNLYIDGTATIDAIQADETITVSGTTQSTSNTSGSIITAGGVGIAKNVTIGGSVNVHGNLHANGNITSDGSLTFGDAATDNVVFAADVNSHIIPNTDDTYDLGSTGQQWRNLYLNGTANLDAVDIDGAVQIDAAVTVGVDGTGQDVKFFGDTASQYMLWDQSDDALELTDASPIRIGDDAAGDMTLYHDGTNSYITNKTGALKLATETSGIAVTIGHTTSETTIGHNLTISGNLTVSGTTTTVTTDTIRMYDKNIEIGVVGTPSDTTADGGGLTLKGATDKTITWVNSTDSWDFNQHIFPSADGTLDLGSTAKKYRYLHISGNVNTIPVSTLATIGDVMALSIALG